MTTAHDDDQNHDMTPVHERRGDTGESDMEGIDTSREAVDRIKESIYFGAEWCQFHPKYYDGFNGSLTDMDTSHDLSGVIDGERFKAGHFIHADTAGYLQGCANAVPALLARAEAAEHVLSNCGIVEIAARNQSVQDYMKHWEGRAEAAEAERDAAKAEVERLRKALIAYGNEQDREWDYELAEFDLENTND